MSGNLQQQPFPNLQSKVVSPDGMLTPVWRTFLAQIWNRTGGAVAASYAFLNGNASETFNVAAATTDTEAVQLGQVQNALPVGASENSNPGTSTTATTPKFTAPSSGLLIVFVDAFNQPGFGATLSASASLGVLTEIVNSGFFYGSGCAQYSLPMLAGEASTITATCTTIEQVPQQVVIRTFFTPTP